MALEKKRNFYKEAILKAVNFITNANDVTTEEEINTQFDRCVESWRMFQEFHLQMLEVTGDEFMDFQKIEFDAVEDSVLPAIARFKSAMRKFVQKPEEDNQSASGHSRDNEINRNNGGLRIPYFKIPLFAGDYDAWPAFKDLFRSLIHFNEKLSYVQKLGYLKINLTGEALKIIRNLEITDANYHTAWNLLVDRYDNERILINRWVHIIVSIPISRGEGEDIKRILDGTQEALQGLKNMGRPVDKYDDFLIYLTETKLDQKSKQRWEDEIADDNNTAPTWEKMAAFLKTRFRALEVNNKGSSIAQVKSNNKMAKSFSNSNSIEIASKPSSEQRCAYCKKGHRLNFCFMFQKKPQNERQAFVMEKKLCENCLNSDHKVSSCTSTFTCRICHQRHNTLLHPHAANTLSVPPAVSSHLACNRNLFDKNSSVLLATALIQVEVRPGVSVQIRALIDQGSQISFITSSTINRLGIRRRPGGPNIKTIGSEITQQSKGLANIEFSSRFNPDNKFQLKVAILDQITHHLPAQYIDISLPQSWETLDLADHTFYQPGPINVLLGADIFGEIIEEGLLKWKEYGIIAQNSALGWLLSGRVKLSKPIPVTSAYNATESDESEIDRQLRAFWEIEECNSSRKMDPDDQICDDHYNETHERNEKGRFVVRLPFRPGFGTIHCLGNSRNIALNNWLRMETRIGKSNELRRHYSDIMNKLLENNYMEPIPVSELIVPSQKSCYLPHHIVERAGKGRIVFNASQKTSSGLSLNDVLLVGPPLQKDLFDIILHVRQFAVAFSADIVKMFRQFLVNKLDVDYQRIIWRQTKSDPIQDYRLLTVLDGTSSAPYLALKTIRSLAITEKSKFPLACEAAERDMYMDDLFSGAHDIQTGLMVRNQLIGLFESAGMELKKWSSNKTEFLDSLPRENLVNLVEFGEDGVIKMLGINWTPASDTFGYRIRINDQTRMTKRLLLSETGKLFDPAGWVSPCIIIPKMLLQSIWLAKLDWDDPLPKEIENKWLEFRQELPCLETIKIPRWTGNKKVNKLIELHGFSDASEKAYAAVVYIKVIDSDDVVSVTLLAAKTKVAPIKSVNLPRLELCGALLLARLLDRVVKAIQIPKVIVHAHTDSMIVLAWLQSRPNRWKTFIANRTSEILEIVPSDHWHYVRSKENPADCASRGQSPSKLASNLLWWNGPNWLREIKTPWHFGDEPVPNVLNVDMEERNVTLVTSLVTILPSWDLRAKYSSLSKLLRVSAYCRRFVNNCRNPKSKKFGILEVEELDKALQYWIKVTQAIHFKDEIVSLDKKKQLSGKSPILNLKPFLDENQVIRVGGRLSQSNLSFDEKHPIILPKYDVLTNLIIAQAHEKTLHGGIQLMLNFIRGKYWILNARSAVRIYVHKCNRCFRFSAKPNQQQMADLPVQRVIPSRSFSHSAVDYAGPIKLKMRKGPGRQTLFKGYISIFVCMTTKAIHLELIGDLTSEAFIAGFKRFVSRRGRVSHLYSDNGSSFVGANGILEEEHWVAMAEMEIELAELLVNDGTQWHFNPPSAPHFNGLVEAGVRSVKYHLRRILGLTNLTYEEMNTVLCQIECVLNSRPISTLTDDFSDLSVLTPGHFLMGSAPLSIPEPSLLDINENRLSRWKLVQKMNQDFWKSWSSDYLSLLQQRPKWQRIEPNIKVGELVLVREDNMPPAKWNLGRIVEIHKGKDDLVRAATVQTQTTLLKRPIVKLSPLPSNQFGLSLASDEEPPQN